MKTTFKYDHYFDYEELSNNLIRLSEEYPDLMELQVNCTTEEGRKQYLAILTNKKTGDMLEKPGFYLDGNIHAGEVTASMCAMHTVDYLLSNYADSEEVREILDEMTIYCIPRVSPDGAEVYLKSPYGIRSVNRTTCEEKGGIREEDLDDDGVIRMMRIQTPYGAWKKDPKDEELMVLRNPGDRNGDFYDIYPEGLLEAYDGSENLKVKKEEWGLDFNRNFPYGWCPEPRQDGAGVYPLSNPETKAIADFVLSHPNIGAAALGHTSGGLLLYPPGTKASQKSFEEDIKVLKAIARMGEEELGYKPLNVYDSFLGSKENYDSGALDDWLFETKGIPAYTMEFWDIATKAGMPVKWGPEKEDVYESLKRFAAILKWVKENAPQYYTGWKKVTHPDFGEVEIGGFNYKFTQQNPPEAFLQQECEADTCFNLRFINALPRLAIDTVKSEMISDGIYRIEAVIGNLGYLSTALTKTGLFNKYVKPVKVVLEAEKTLSGKKETEIEELQGYSSTLTGVFYYGNITTEKSASARKKLVWIVKGNKGDTLTIRASQEKAGRVEHTITL